VAVISVKGLEKSYGSTRALKGIAFEVAEGEVFALLGPNGAGKTTTVEILEGYRARDAGTVTVLGFDPARGGTRMRERVGIVLQECGIEELLTAREVLDRHAGYYPNPRPVDETIQLVDLADKANDRIRTLSGGQRRRLDLALALIGDPDLLFLDEPTTGFDPQARRNAWELVRRLCRLGKTVLLTTHYMDEAQQLADRVGVISDGRLVALGSPDAIGGRDSKGTQIRFGLPNGIGLSELPLPARLEAGRALVESTDAVRALHALTSWALGRHIDLDGLTVTRRSLEDAYLELVGEHPQAENGGTLDDERNHSRSAGGQPSAARPASPPEGIQAQ
jgi:ABC-2 type transport system ATP-binding protein